MKDNSENRTADCLLEVPEAAAMLVLEPATLSEEPPLPIRLPTLEQVEAASLDVLPTLLGTLETIKTKALVRLIGTSQTAPNPEGDADRYLTVPEVAQRLALTDQYVYEAIRTGDLPAIEIGPKKYKRVALTDLRAWAASKRLDPPTNVTYSRPRGRRRSTTTPQATRGNATRTRGPSRRGTEQRSSVGARGTRGARVGRPIDAAPGETSGQATTWQEEYLSDGLH